MFLSCGRRSLGLRSKFGWALFGTGSRTPPVLTPMQELILDASVVALNPTTPVEGQENVTAPTGFLAAVRTVAGLLSGLVILLFDPDPDTDVACMFQTVLPLQYHGGDLEITVELAAGDDSTAADAEMYALIQAEPPGTDIALAPVFGTGIPLTTTMGAQNAIVQATATISGAQLDGLVAGNAFRVLLGRHAADAYAGPVVFVRGRVREILA